MSRRDDVPGEEAESDKEDGKKHELPDVAQLALRILSEEKSDRRIENLKATHIDDFENAVFNFVFFGFSHGKFRWPAGNAESRPIMDERGSSLMGIFLLGCVESYKHRGMAFLLADLGSFDG